MRRNDCGRVRGNLEGFIAPEGTALILCNLQRGLAERALNTQQVKATVRAFRDGGFIQRAGDLEPAYPSDPGTHTRAVPLLLDAKAARRRPRRKLVRTMQAKMGGTESPGFDPPASPCH